ncbi:MAG: hypothetical protein M1G31_15300 [Pseudanabaena sp. Salubria-1]|nr:hypothetical protein [Pseudanabaena sp. Salubria-1]MCX5934253.1 hypothetical protein [Pseudanabaena sp. LacPavin_0818_WC45_MAG_42_6]
MSSRIERSQFLSTRLYLRSRSMMTKGDRPRHWTVNTNSQKCGNTSVN